METQFVDRQLTCVDCGGEFTFTAGQQQFFADKLLKNDPKRCEPCRSAKKARMAEGQSQPRDRVDHPIVCEQCGENTTVPFVPSGNRPVYCRPCFRSLEAVGA